MELDFKKNKKKHGLILNSNATVMALFNTIMCKQKSFVAPHQERSTVADLGKKSNSGHLTYSLNIKLEKWVKLEFLKK